MRAVVSLQLLLATSFIACAHEPQRLTLESRPLSNRAWFVIAHAGSRGVLLSDRDRIESGRGHAQDGSPGTLALPELAIFSNNALQTIPVELFDAGGWTIGRARVLGRTILVALDSPPLRQSPRDAGSFVVERNHRLWRIGASGPSRQITADTVGPYRFDELAARQREGEVILYWASDPLWSPDGRHVSYLTNRESVLDRVHGQSVWIVDLARGVERPLLVGRDHSYRHAGWLDGELLFFGDSMPGVWAVNPRTGARRPVSDGHVSATSRTGTAAAISRGDSVIVLMRGREIELPMPPQNHHYTSEAEFSPNGRRLAIGIADDRGVNHLRVFDLASRRMATFDYPDTLSPTHRPVWLDDVHMLLNGQISRPKHPDPDRRRDRPHALVVDVIAGRNR